MPKKQPCKPEHHTWHPSPTGMGPAYCYHCDAVKPGTEAKPAPEPEALVLPPEAKPEFYPGISKTDLSLIRPSAPVEKDTAPYPVPSTLKPAPKAKK